MIKYLRQRHNQHFSEFYESSRKGGLYNAGDGNSKSGGHIWYMNGVSKFQNHFPTWSLKYNIDYILSEIPVTAQIGSIIINNVLPLSEQHSRNI